MAYVVRMPKLGVEMETGIVIAWHVEAGAAVEEGDVIAEIESEKSTAEVVAREDGVLRRVYMAEGDEGPPGTAMGIVAGSDEDVSDLAAEVDATEPGSAAGGASADEGAAPTDEEAPPSAGPAAGPDAAGDGPTADTDAAGDAPAVEADAADVGDATGSDGGEATGSDGGDAAPAADVAPRTEYGRVKASPRAKRRAEELGVALSTVGGTGPEGGIVAADVEAATSAGGQRTVSEERPMTPMRETIAERLGRSAREAVHVTVDRDVDVEAAFEAAALADEGAAVDVAITDVFLAAVSATLADHPAFNATFDAEAGVHTLYEEHNLGVAVDLEGGLVTPVIPDVRGRSPADVAGVRRRLVERVLDGEYDGEDLAGGTFTVSNLGAVGSDSFTPVINPPEVAILGINRVHERAVNTDTGIDFRRHVTFSLSFDHRVVDGADAARFLTTLDEHLQDATALVGP